MVLLFTKLFYLISSWGFPGRLGKEEEEETLRVFSALCVPLFDVAEKKHATLTNQPTHSLQPKDLSPPQAKTHQSFTYRRTPLCGTNQTHTHHRIIFTYNINTFYSLHIHFACLAHNTWKQTNWDLKLNI